MICGLFVCAHLAALGATEAHHQEFGKQPAIVVDALPTEPDHTHQDYDGAARIVDVDLGILDAMNNPPPDQSYLLAARIARKNWEQRWPAAQMPWMYAAAADELPSPPAAV